MNPSLHRATLALSAPLGTPLAGDTLFGQFCWALREAVGEAELVRRLEGYTTGRPWLVVSDGFPAGFLPKPTLPARFEPKREPEDRKAAKKNRWISLDAAHLPLGQMLSKAKTDAEAYDKAPQRAVQFHNTINRATGTTGEGDFAPYTMPLIHHAPGQNINLWLVLDEARTSADEARLLLTAIGQTGFGRDASIGLGKFDVIRFEAANPPSPPEPPSPNAYWALAPCAPQGQGFDGNRSYWRVLTRFGRHGNAHALSPNPFKNPILLAATGAVFAPTKDTTPRLFVGQGLGGDWKLSKTEHATVHQGYAPVVPLYLPPASAQRGTK